MNRHRYYYGISARAENTQPTARQRADIRWRGLEPTKPIRCLAADIAAGIMTVVFFISAFLAAEIIAAVL